MILKMDTKNLPIVKIDSKIAISRTKFILNLKNKLITKNRKDFVDDS